MIKIEKTKEKVSVHLPIRVINFDREYFDWISDNIYFIYSKTPNSNKIIREKGNIEELNMGHWLCLFNRYQANFNDKTMKTLDVDFIIREYSNYTNDKLKEMGISI